MLTFFHRLAGLIFRVVSFLEQAFLYLARPSHPSIVVRTAIDFRRSNADLVAEKALLRQQLIVPHRQA